MFDIGFWELVVVGVVALVVVGPDEFPTLVRNAGRWMSKARQFINSVKQDFDHEIEKAEELKRLIAQETQIAELHKLVDETQATIPIGGRKLSPTSIEKTDEKTPASGTDESAASPERARSSDGSTQR